MKGNSSWSEMWGCFILYVVLPLICGLIVSVLSIFLKMDKTAFMWTYGILYVLSIGLLLTYGKIQEKGNKTNTHKVSDESTKNQSDKELLILDTTSNSKPKYKSHCFRCNSRIDSKICKECSECKYYKCNKCGVCFCDYKK